MDYGALSKLGQLRTCNMPGTSEAALSLLRLQPPSRLLDLGCFEGDVSRFLLSQSFIVSSCDVVAREGTRTLPDFHLMNADDGLPFPDSSFDGVLFTEVIEHLERPIRAIREIGRILRSGGVCVLSTPSVDSLFSRAIFLVTGRFPLFAVKEFSEWGHISPISLAWLKCACERHGMCVEEVTSEVAQFGWKRRLFWGATRPFRCLFWRSQSAVWESGHSLVVRIVKK